MTKDELIVSLVGELCANMMWFEMDDLLELRPLFEIDPATLACFDAFISLRKAVPAALDVANKALEEMEL